MQSPLEAKIASSNPKQLNSSKSDSTISLLHRDALNTSIYQIESSTKLLSILPDKKRLANTNLTQTLLTLKNMIFNLQYKFKSIEMVSPFTSKSLSLDDFDPDTNKNLSPYIALGLVFYYINELLTALLHYLNEMKVFFYSKLNYDTLELYTKKLKNIIEILPIASNATFEEVFVPKLSVNNNFSIETVEDIVTPELLKQFSSLHHNIFFANSFVNIGKGYPLLIRLLMSAYGIVYYSLADCDLNGAIISQSADADTAVTIWNLPDTLTFCCFALCIHPIFNNYTFNIEGLNKSDPQIQLRLLYDQSLSINCCYFSPIPELDLIIHIHGGGFVGMSSFSHQSYTRRWAVDCEIPLISIDYRLAPKNKYPCALDDCYAAYKWCNAHTEEIGFKVNRIILVGDSAGGNLVCGVVIRCIRDGYRLPNGIVLCYPALVVYKIFAPSLCKSLEDPIVPYRFLNICLASYLGEMGTEALNDPCLCPLFASNSILSKFPPTRIMTGSLDPIHDHSIMFGSKLHQNGVNVLVHTYEGLPHGFLSFDAPLIGVDECGKCIDKASKWIRDLLYLD